MNETLVIVHLSSVFNYIDHYKSIGAAQQLINDIRLAIVTHPGPTIIMDQEWPEISEDARVLRQMVLDMQKIDSHIIIFHHCEFIDIFPWQDGMKRLASLLRQLQTRRVRLGGFWTSQSGETGCVHEVQRQMRARNFACYIDKPICALEEHDTRIAG